MTQHKTEQIAEIGNHAIIKLIEGSNTYQALRPHYQIVNLSTNEVIKDGIRDYRSLRELLNDIKTIEGLEVN